MILFLLLLLADAPPQTTLPLPVRPPQTTLVAPELLRPPKAKPDLERLTLQEGAALAAKAKLPLVVWVGSTYDDAEIRSRLPKCVQVRVEAWKGSGDHGIVCCPLHGGGPLGIVHPAWPHARRLIPKAEAKIDDVLKELSGDWLRQPRSEAPVMRGAAVRSC